MRDVLVASGDHPYGRGHIDLFTRLDKDPAQDTGSPASGPGALDGSCCRTSLLKLFVH